jgi:hypothetical protein
MMMALLACEDANANARSKNDKREKIVRHLLFAFALEWLCLVANESSLYALMVCMTPGSHVEDHLFWKLDTSKA